MENPIHINKITISGSNMCYLSVPEDIALYFIEAGNKRVICTVDQSFEFHCAIQRSKTIGYYITMGKKTLKSGNLLAGQVVDIILTPDNTKYQSEIPEELEEILKSDFEAYEKFHQLTPGKQRSIIYLVTGVKSSDKRIDRALKIMENIKIGVTGNKDLLK